MTQDTSVAVEKIPGGFSIDGLELKRGKCGCTSLARCCYSWSKVKKKDASLYEFTAKLSDPDTTDNHIWSYTARKGGITVTVRVEDARDKVISAGYIPPAAAAWEEKGWIIVDKEGDREDAAVWKCAMCKWLYKEDEEEIPFAELSDTWRCPTCGVPKSQFERIG